MIPDLNADQRSNGFDVVSFGILKHSELLVILTLSKKVLVFSLKEGLSFVEFLDLPFRDGFLVWVPGESFIEWGLDKNKRKDTALFKVQWNPTNNYSAGKQFSM